MCPVQACGGHEMSSRKAVGGLWHVPWTAPGGWHHACPFSWIFYFLRSGQEIFRRGMPRFLHLQNHPQRAYSLVPESLEMISHVFLLMRGYWKVTSRNFHSSPFAVAYSSYLHLPGSDTETQTAYLGTRSNGRILDQMLSCLWVDLQSRKQTCVTVLILPLGSDRGFLVSPQDLLLYPLAHSSGLTSTLVAVLGPLFPWKKSSCPP